MTASKPQSAPMKVIHGQLELKKRPNPIPSETKVRMCAHVRTAYIITLDYSQFN